MANYDSISKICSKCQHILPFENFYKNRSKVDGFATECKACSNAKGREYYAKNRDAERLKRKKDYQLNGEAYRRRAKVWSSANHDKVQLYRQAWRALNKDKILEFTRLDWETHAVKRRASKKRWRDAHPAACAEMVRRRQARLLQALPVWADLCAIRKVYEAAKIMEAITGEKWHVDHFYPLRGKLVSGLHVAGNLRVIQATVNQRKSNKHPEEH